MSAASRPAVPSIIDGRAIARDISFDLAKRVNNLVAISGGNCRPHFVAIQIGHDPSSSLYAQIKQKAAMKIGVKMTHYKFEDDISKEALCEIISELNQNRNIHGIMVQFPLPTGFEHGVIDTIDPQKDVDGLHSLNIGLLVKKGCTPSFIPCTPKACVELLVRSHINISGAKVTIIGRSNIVGTPVSHLLNQMDATITLCHSKTVAIEDVVRSADIVISCIGIPLFVKGSWFKPGATVIDVGIHSISDPRDESGSIIVGDVDTNSGIDHISAITPVPGGVGPVTVAMIMSNVIYSAEKFHSRIL